MPLGIQVVSSNWMAAFTKYFRMEFFNWLNFHFLIYLNYYEDGWKHYATHAHHWTCQIEWFFSQIIHEIVDTGYEQLRHNNSDICEFHDDKTEHFIHQLDFLIQFHVNRPRWRTNLRSYLKKRESKHRFVFQQFRDKKHSRHKNTDFCRWIPRNFSLKWKFCLFSMQRLWYWLLQTISLWIYKMSFHIRRRFPLRIEKMPSLTCTVASRKWEREDFLHWSNTLNGIIVNDMCRIRWFCTAFVEFQTIWLHWTWLQSISNWQTTLTFFKLNSFTRVHAHTYTKVSFIQLKRNW